MTFSNANYQMKTFVFQLKFNGHSFLMVQLTTAPLQWLHNEHDGVSNHQPHHCLPKCLFGRRKHQRKHQSSASLAFVRGINWSPVNSPHKGPVTYGKCFHLMTSSCQHWSRQWLGVEQALGHFKPMMAKVHWTKISQDRLPYEFLIF